MDTAIISTMAGVLGTLAGGSATVTIAWITQKTLSRRELVLAKIQRRETLYGEFINECSKLVMDSFANTLDRPETLLPAYALLNRIRLKASDTVLKEADHILKWITEQYFAPNLTIEEMRVLLRSGDADPLKQFGEACRAELKSLQL